MKLSEAKILERNIQLCVDALNGEINHCKIAGLVIDAKVEPPTSPMAGQVKVLVGIRPSQMEPEGNQ